MTDSVHEKELWKMWLYGLATGVLVILIVIVVWNNL